jgi:hypothetical protein
MSANPNTGLNALQFKTIDGLQIRFALSEEKNGDPILFSVRGQRASTPSFRPGTGFLAWARSLQWICPDSVALKAAPT